MSWTALRRVLRGPTLAHVDQHALPTVLSETALSNAFLGKVVEICIVTEDHHRTMAGLVRLGIGPFRVYTFDDQTLTEPTHRGRPSPFSLTVCFATNDGMTWEVMQPLSGPSIMREFLDAHGEGIHHVAFAGDGRSMEERVATFAERGFAPTQSGRWNDQNLFTFFDTEAATTTCFETYHFPDGYTYPEPDEWYPGPPPGA